MKEHDENEDQQNDDDGCRNGNACAEVVLILGVIHSH